MRITRIGVGAFALAFVFISFGADLAFAVTLPAENHYKVYRNLNPVSLTRPITLSDEFGTFNSNNMVFDRFATPAVKKLRDGTVYPMINPDVHMDWWRISPTGQPAHTVVVTDQFSSTQWILGETAYLLTPSLKNVQPDSTGGPRPPVWNHYVCYDVIKAPLLNQSVTLIDQFGSVDVVVVQPRYFCNPAEKLDHGALYPIIDNTAHLAVYQVQNSERNVYNISTIDQFGFWKISISQNEYLCVPALSDTPVPTKQTTWGKIKSLYRN